MESVKTEAWGAYRSAFDQYTQTAREVRRLVESSDQNGISIALLELEKARAEYDARRDALADCLLPEGLRKSFVSDRTQEYDSSVRTIAELLWESAGRPEGTADCDWSRAEEIVREAAYAAHG
jgi:hypothetical protein